MKKTLIFVLALTVSLTAVSFLSWVLWFHLFWDGLSIPVGLGGGLSVFLMVPLTFLLAIPYALGSKWLLIRWQIVAEKHHFWVALLVGSLMVIFLTGFCFPCTVPPYYVGGYLVTKWIAH